MNQTIFLIGAGASVDAGLPLVTELTEELRARLSDLRDMNGNRCTEFPELFDSLAEYDPEIRSNYEKFFEWLNFLRQGQTGAFGKAACFKLDQRLVDAVPYLIFSIKQPIWEILRSRHQGPEYDPGYFKKLGDFVPVRGRLKVFTTNYDLCIEDACRAHGINVITGFRLGTMRWSPPLFQNRASGINLYKLHGSLNWNLRVDQNNLENSSLVEHCPVQWDKEPEFLLGPGSKLQHDEPFVTLYANFHQAVRRASVFVAIGHSLRDNHISEPVRIASHRGMKLIEVNPSPIEWTHGRYLKIRMGAKEAFESGEILKAVQGSDP
jgi:hypothetical protein